MGELEFTLPRSAYVLLFVCLVVLPVAYWRLCKCMASVSNAPTMEFFMIFGSVGGFLFLAALAPSFPCGFVSLFPFLLCAYGCLIFSMVTALREFPRSRWHVAAAIISGVIMLIPIAMVLWTIKAGGFSFAQISRVPFPPCLCCLHLFCRPVTHAFSWWGVSRS